MPRLAAFNSPLMLGFDHLERLVESVAKASSEGYPPYNIEQTGSRGLDVLRWRSQAFVVKIWMSRLRIIS